MLTHTYETHLTWTGSTADGYRTYSRTHQAVTVPETQELTLSSDKAFRGDPMLLNPEQLLVMAASSCQMLSFLAVAARHGVTVVRYSDVSQGWMDMADKPQRVGRIRIDATIEVEGDVEVEEVRRMAHQAHEECFIANSLTSAIELEVTVLRR
ncbi:MAG: OsmC family protein [Propionibacteriaceae bacterium]